MSVRLAELLGGILLALVSIAFMWKSTRGLSIWWIPGSGPGSGAWPFWLSVIMLLSCLTIIVRWFMRVTPQSRSEEVFIDATATRMIGITVIALALLLLGTYYVGLYISLLLFLIFYLRVVGGHSWTLSVVLALGIPIFIFFFFEYLMTIPMPKGISEPLFYPIYDLIY
ncbi:MAG: tripartite tricarboxylate transporter TctB family protein [Propylenella sp.]